MEEKKPSTCTVIYVWFCKVLLVGLIIAAIVLMILFTPSNPIFKAAYEGKLSIIKEYIKEGGGLGAQDKWNNTALHWAAKGNQIEIAAFLIDNGLDGTIRNAQGETALHWSVLSNNDTMITYLVSKHININEQNTEGETPLHLSIIMNAFQSARSLLQNGANPNIISHNGNTALHYISPGCAEAESCRDLINAFKDAGCDFSIVNSKGVSVLQVIAGDDYNRTQSLFENDLWHPC